MSKAQRKPLRERWRAARSTLRRKWLSGAGTAAAGAGYSLRLLPGVAGPVLVAYGLWLAWAPLGFIALGGFLLWADRRMS